jgi:hypothetical protein
VADDACFSSRIISWLDCVPRDNPLLVQPIDSDDSYSASLRRYSGVVHASKGVEGQCCIPNCTRIFPEEHRNGWMCSYLKEHATNQNDVEQVGPVCHFHYYRIYRADKRNRAIKKLTSKKCAKACWMNPVETASHDDDNMDELNTLTEGNETICIRYHDSRIATQKDVTYTRRSPDSPWTFA